MEARQSTDEESAPLLQTVSHPDGTSSQPTTKPLSERVLAIASEPLTPLSKVLCVVALIFLLLSSIFIGLFAGAEHKLKSGRQGNETPTSTITSTVTHIATSIYTETATTTSVGTSTTVSTSTVNVPAPGPTDSPKEPTCLTPDCIILASSILSSVDTSQDPCENFYDYANGGWIKANPIPSDKGRFGSFDKLAVQNKRLIQQILSPDSSSVYSSYSESALSSPPYDAQILKKLRTLYASCMDENLLNELGTTPLMRVIKKVEELYRENTTVVDSESVDKNGNGLTAAIAFLHSRGIDALFSVGIDGDVGEDPNFMSLWFSQPSLGLPSKEYYEEEDITDLYRDVIESLLLILSEEEDKLQPPKSLSSPAPGLAVHEERLRVWPPWPWPPWGGDDDDDDDGKDKPKLNRTERAHKLANDVLVFEKRLANITLDLDVLQSDPFGTYNPVPFENFSSSIPEIHFPAYFSAFTPRSFPATVILTSTAFPSDLSALLNGTTSPTVEAYLITRATLQLASRLGTETPAWRAARRLQEKLQGIKPGAQGDRAEYCAGQAENALGFAVGRYFVNETFGGASREKGTRIIEDIIKTFKSSLKGLDWMDDQSAKAAAQKADAIHVQVGFPLSPDTLDPRSIANYYSQVQINQLTFFENMLRASTVDQFRMWSKLGKQRNIEEWEMNPSTVNAYFDPPANKIVFPAGIMQPPFFSQYWPAYMAYGAFGMVAAHELTHAFDSSGRLYNPQGKLEHWWTNETSEGFLVRQDCIVKQYSEYTVDDGKGGKVHVNGNLTSGENIGDSGLIQAYRAWQAQYASFHGEHDFILPGLNYTRDQLFFVAAAQAFASNIKPAAAVAQVRSDPHSPNRYRIEGTVSNIPEFAKAFNCPTGAKLNPPNDKRCMFWG